MLESGTRLQCTYERNLSPAEESQYGGACVISAHPLRRLSSVILVIEVILGRIQVFAVAEQEVLR